MSKHTPGPWRWMEKELNDRIVKRLGKSRGQINKKDGALVYALVGPLKGATTDEGNCDVFDYREVMVLHWSQVRGVDIYEGFPCKEDARLIAAAPDLLAACKAANKSLSEMAARGGWLPGEAGIDEWSRVQQGLSAAIARAEGGGQ